ncbi:MAG: hypothetical protein KGY60_12120 [Bacteroidales bacterium]|nr:hypothetical protein [Bacteroidales bacterium]
MQRIFFLLIFMLVGVLILGNPALGQERTEDIREPQIRAENQTINFQQQEQILHRYFDSLAHAREDDTRDALNKKILSRFRRILDDPRSFDYPFDSIQNAGILKSADGKIRLYNWNVPYEAGYNIFQCFLQYKKADTLLTYELNDQSEKIEKPESQTLDKDKWYGALYYDIIVKQGRFDRTYYTLLGFDPNDFLSNRKVIDVLYFDKQDQPVFGAAIFKNRQKVSQRILFEYNEFANMMLRYDQDKEMIVYDHLSPSKPQYEGQREYYGPDFSYDGLKFENGIWNTYFDLDLRLNEIDFDE